MDLGRRVSRGFPGETLQPRADAEGLRSTTTASPWFEPAEPDVHRGCQKLRIAEALTAKASPYSAIDSIELLIKAKAVAFSLLWHRAC